MVDGGSPDLAGPQGVLDQVRSVDFERPGGLGGGVGEGGGAAVAVTGRPLVDPVGLE